MAKQKKPKRGGLQEAYEAFLASQPKQEEPDVVEKPQPLFSSRSLEHLVPGCWIKLECHSPVPGYPTKYYSSRVVKVDVDNNHILFEFPLTSSIGRGIFLSEFTRNSHYTICSTEEGEQILKSLNSLLEINRQLCVDGMLRNGVGGRGGSGFASENKGMHHDSSSSNDQDGFLSPGYD